MTSLQELPIPTGEHILIHARIKGVANYLEETDYGVVAARLLDCLRATNAKSVVVPTFTYDFTKSLQFSASETPSEVGRFSEEVRKLCPVALRTLDPVFSVIDVDDHGWTKQLNLDAFGDDSLWRRWQEQDALIVNLDLPHIVATQFHFIEKLADVPYRYDKVFSGQITDADGKTMAADYNYYVRNLEGPSTWNRVLLEQEIDKANKLNEFEWCGIRGTWFRAKEVEEILLPIMRRDPEYLLDPS